MSADLFHPHKCLGLVSNDLPLVVRYIERRKENLIVTSIGNAFHTYGATKLTLLSVSNAHTGNITCISADAFHIYTASGSTVYAWRRGTELKHKYIDHEADVYIILPFGPHLITVDRKNILYIWDIKTEELVMKKCFNQSLTISCLLHPATYLNKILIGTEEGKMLLWNMLTNEDIYLFKGWDSEVKVLEQAPALDVVAIGLQDGRIFVHNLKYDETIVQFKQDWGMVTSISFRTDGFPIMISASAAGHIALWDLKTRTLSSQIRDAHSAKVSSVVCLANEPLMITSSPDNSIKKWIFDLPDGGARLLTIRDGHSKCPLVSRFHGSLGNKILTAGEDSTLRMFATNSDAFCKSFGQASYNRKISKRSKGTGVLKMPAITMFTSETSQEKCWDNIAAIHRRKAVVTTWSVYQQKMGEHKLLHERFNEKIHLNTAATCLDLTMCGNYVIIGYNSGHIDKYNIQSGIYRGSFGKPTAHSEQVTGVVADGLNQSVISSGQEGEIRWWRLKDCRGTQKLDFQFGITIIRLHRDSSLLAVAFDDWSVQLIDTDTKIVVRKFYGHSNAICDLSFSADSKWLVSSSLDKSIRTWDLPSGKCVNWFEVPTPASSLTMSPVGDLLATTHAGHLGVCIWVNKACYDHIPLKPIDKNYKPRVVQLPSTAADSSAMPPAENEETCEEPVNVEAQDDEYKSPEQISEDLITLSLLPSSRWLNLLNIDVIKKRNKPIEPPKTPKSAPFFLPSVPGLDFKFAVDSTQENNSNTKIKPITSFEMLTPFGEILRTKDYKKAIEMLLEMGPSGIDVEIRGLDPDTGGSDEVMIEFLKMIDYCIDSRKQFEAVEGYLGLFLKVHGEYLINNNEARQLCENINIKHKNIWLNLRNNLDQSLCLLSYFKNASLINC